MEVIRNKFTVQGLSDEVVGLLLGGIRPTTCASYQSSWNSWLNWCRRFNKDPLSGTLNSVLEFLTAEFRSGKAYRSLNVTRSMLSGTLGKIDGVPIGRHPLVSMLMKGAYVAKPPMPRYNHTWDPDQVLIYLKTIENSKAKLIVLSRKLVTLLALATLSRSSEIASIRFDSVVFYQDSVVFSLNKPTKTQKGVALRSLSIKRLPEIDLDPVACLKSYVDLTAPLRNQSNSSFFFVGAVKPHKPVSSSTIGRWIKQSLSDSGIDTQIFSAHSTRGAASSKAAAAGVPVESIMQTAQWSSESTFARHYRRDLPIPFNVQDAVFQSG